MCSLLVDFPTISHFLDLSRNKKTTNSDNAMELIRQKKTEDSDHSFDNGSV